LRNGTGRKIPPLIAEEGEEEEEKKERKKEMKKG
jgi:hypothetical protein